MLSRDLRWRYAIDFLRERLEMSAIKAKDWNWIVLKLTDVQFEWDTGCSVDARRSYFKNDFGFINMALLIYGKKPEAVALVSDEIL